MSRPRSRVTRERGGAAAQAGGPPRRPFDEGIDGPGGWPLLDEPELHLGPEPDIIVPDLAGWRRDRMPELPVDQAFLTLAPDWACEVLSPCTEATDRADKMEIYAREGVLHVGLIDPTDRTLEVYRLEKADPKSPRWLRLGVWRGDAVVRADPFDAIELPLAMLWAR